MVRRITQNRIDSREQLVNAAANPHDGQFPCFIDAWKLVICDIREIGSNENLHDAYVAQLQEEEAQNATARAKEIVRTEEERVARRNARWFIRYFEELPPGNLEQLRKEDEDVMRVMREGSATEKIWKRVSPEPPGWINHIVAAEQPWGFVFYHTNEITDQYGGRWAKTWEVIREQTRCIPHCGWDDRSLIYASLDNVHCRGNRSKIQSLWTEDWPAEAPGAGTIQADEIVRKHFRKYRESLSSPNILRNTFIVVDAKAIPDDLDPVVHNAIPPFWVWAYDADWENSGLEPNTMNGDEYQGRVKVSLYSLDAWFYAARYEGVSLQDMWMKAQNDPLKQWVCFSNPLEEWEHESYT